MKKRIVDQLICPACLPGEHALKLEAREQDGDDVLEGCMKCPHCSRTYPIHEGIASLLVEPAPDGGANKYEHQELVSSYLWSHYGDLAGEEMASDAYLTWAGELNEMEGWGLDLGAAVGRFTFEMGARCEFAIGLDNSQAFIRTARELMRKRSLKVELKEEGEITREIEVVLPDHFLSDRVEFVVGDALQLPFRSQSAATISSLNLVDKVPRPRLHLAEMMRTAAFPAQMLLSDPFSWSPEAAHPDEWLGGRKEGKFPGRGLDNIRSILENGKDNQSHVQPWRVEKSGHAWWKIRTHSNHFELIRSCYIKAGRP